MSKKIKLTVVFGGRSGEHDVSLMSATNILNAIDRENYEVSMVGINREGQWFSYGGAIDRLITHEWEEEAEPFRMEVLFNPETKPDVIFPVLHGPNGEDGTVQGLFELTGVPYVGCGVLASATCMDKEFAKILFQNAGLRIVPYLTIWAEELESCCGDAMERVEQLGYPVFVKPANMGSSVGISKVSDRTELLMALREAAKYDHKLLVEQGINGREIELAVLGNRELHVSGAGEIIPSHDFYDYVAKYYDGDNSRILIPAPLSDEKLEELRAAAGKAFTALNCSGLARIDFFVDRETEDVYINEINTMPGFTRISMYPKLWQAQGLGYRTLIDRLIGLALEDGNPFPVVDKAP